MIQVQEEEWVRRTAHNLEDLTRTSGLKTRTKRQKLCISRHPETTAGLAIEFRPVRGCSPPKKNAVPTQEHSWGGWDTLWDRLRGPARQKRWSLNGLRTLDSGPAGEEAFAGGPHVGTWPCPRDPSIQMHVCSKTGEGSAVETRIPGRRLGDCGLARQVPASWDGHGSVVLETNNEKC